MLSQLFGEFISSPPVAWLYLNIFPHIDRPLLRLTGGRVSLTVGAPVLLLTTRGAKSGQLRTTPLVYVRDGDNIALIASNGGQPRNPAWYYNLRANPDAELTVGERSGRYLAHEAQGVERERLWRKAVALNPGYAVYQRRAGGRVIPVMVLVPAGKGT